jgi:molecular chaperone HscA
LGRSYKDVAEHAAYYSYKIIDEDTQALVKIEVNGRFYNPIELSSLILKELKQRAESVLDQPVSKAVITVPAYFNDSQRQATRDAGKLAGLDVLRIVNEPTAASLAYGLGMNVGETKTIAVYDLGGGTFDITILRIENGVFEVLSTNGDTYTGGDDFDRAIVNHWAAENGWNMAEVNADKIFSQQLRLKAEEAKKTLSTEIESNTSINYRQSIVSLSLKRSQFESLISQVIDKTISCCELALKDSSLQKKEIDEVVMVGGSTRVPAVYNAVRQYFNKTDLHNNLNPDEVVALGAAVEADILAGNRRDMLLLDVTPLSLGIETLGGLMDVIIPRNSKVPSKTAREYTTSVDGQKNLKISVYQGEREMVAENRKLAEFILGGIPAMPAGLPKIQITFLLNADGILKIEAEELRSGTKQQIEVKPQYGLTDEQVETMLLESLQFAESDMKQRMLAESRTEGQQLLYACNKMLGSSANVLNESEIAGTKEIMSSLENKLKSEDRDAILQEIERLNDYTRPFAERLMDEAIGKALKGNNILE